MRRRNNRVLVCQIVSLAVLAASILAVYFVDLRSEEENYRTLLLVNGLVFWGSALLLIAFSVCLCHFRRGGKKNAQSFSAKQLGLFRFFQNKPAAAADVLSLLSFAAFLWLAVIRKESGLAAFLSLSAWVLTFGLHCILNGVNYISIMQDKKGGKVSE